MRRNKRKHSKECRPLPFLRGYCGKDMAIAVQFPILRTLPCLNAVIFSMETGSRSQEGIRHAWRRTGVPQMEASPAPHSLNWIPRVTGQGVELPGDVSRCKVALQKQVGEWSLSSGR